MPNPKPVYLRRDEHAHYIRVQAITATGVEIAHYNTTPDDTKECEKLYYMEQNLTLNGYWISPPPKEAIK